jgi:hypothetical protein
MKEKIKKTWKFIIPLGLLASVTILYFLFIFDIGINTSYFIKRDFTTAFLARKTGNCDLFIEYIYTDKEKWRERCIKEKDGDASPIKEFFIKEITTKGNLAFLQVHLKRDIPPKVRFSLDKEEFEILEKGYIVNYDLIKDNSAKFIFFPRTRWLIKNEVR